MFGFSTSSPCVAPFCCLQKAHRAFDVHADQAGTNVRGLAASLCKDVAVLIEQRSGRKSIKRRMLQIFDHLLFKLVSSWWWRTQYQLIFRALEMRFCSLRENRPGIVCPALEDRRSAVSPRRALSSGSLIPRAISARMAARSGGMSSDMSHSSQVTGTNVAIPLDLQCRGDVGGHHAERLLRRANVDRLPVAVQNQNRCFSQYVTHRFLHCFSIV
jgi:hypothetical protein